jgi:hypothetical protein
MLDRGKREPGIRKRQEIRIPDAETVGATEVSAHVANQLTESIEDLLDLRHGKGLDRSSETAKVGDHDVLIRDHARPVRLFDPVHRDRPGEPLQVERVDEPCADFRLVHSEPGGSGQVDLVRWGEGFDARREDNGVADEGAFLMQHVAERDDDTHGQPPVTLGRLGKAQLLLHGHRGQRPRRHAREGDPEPIAFRLDDVAVVRRCQTANELAMLGQ